MADIKKRIFKRSTHPAPPRKLDLRINRLVVAIWKSEELKGYFSDYLKMKLTCTYLGISTPSGFHIEDIIVFLDSLYFEDVEIFRQLMEYALNEIKENVRVPFYSIFSMGDGLS